jgi:hypothetical protein
VFLAVANCLIILFGQWLGEYAGLSVIFLIPWFVNAIWIKMRGVRLVWSLFFSIPLGVLLMLFCFYLLYLASPAYMGDFSLIGLGLIFIIQMISAMLVAAYNYRFSRRSSHIQNKSLGPQ